MDLSSTLKPFSQKRKDLLSETLSKTTQNKTTEKNTDKSQTKISLSELSKTTNTSVFSFEEIKFSQNSLFFFNSDNKIRIKIQKIVFHRAFTLTIDILIIINSIILVFDTLFNIKLLKFMFYINFYNRIYIKNNFIWFCLRKKFLFKRSMELDRFFCSNNRINKFNSRNLF